MPPISPVSWAFAACALLAPPIMAQTNKFAPAPHGLAVTAPLPYAPALEGYQPYSEEKVRPWKESNTTVEKIGGWRAYAKEAAEPETKANQTPPANPATGPKAPAAPADPHAGHGKHQGPSL